MPKSFIEDIDLPLWIRFYLEYGKCAISHNFISKKPLQIIDICDDDDAMPSNDYEQSHLLSALHENPMNVKLMPQIYSSTSAQLLKENPFSRRKIYSFASSRNPKSDGDDLDKLQYFIDTYLIALQEHLELGNLDEVCYWINTWNKFDPNQDWNVVLPSGHNLQDAAYSSNEPEFLVRLQETYGFHYEPKPIHDFVAFLEHAEKCEYSDEEFVDKFREYMADHFPPENDAPIEFLEQELIGFDVELKETDKFYPFKGLTPLQYASATCAYKLARALIALGAKSHIQQRSDLTEEEQIFLGGEYQSRYEQLDSSIENHKKNEFMLAVDNQDLEMLVVLKDILLPTEIIFVREELYLYLISLDDEEFFEDVDRIYGPLLTIDELLSKCLKQGSYDIFMHLVKSERYFWNPSIMESELFEDILQSILEGDEEVPEEVLIYMLSMQQIPEGMGHVLEGYSSDVMSAVQKSMYISSVLRNIVGIADKEIADEGHLYRKLYAQCELLKTAMQHHNNKDVFTELANSSISVETTLMRLQPQTADSVLQFSRSSSSKKGQQNQKRKRKVPGH